jgi:hypothetical protein
VAVASHVGATQNYHPNPRLSANQLAEYLTANATARRRILQDAKFKPTMIVIRYRDARSAVVDHFNGTERALDDAITRLKERVDSGDTTEYIVQNCELCIDAIKSFQRSKANLEVGNTQFSKPKLHNTKLQISGVSVSVSLDLMTEELDKHGKRSKGAAILVFSKNTKSEKLMAGRCKAIALLVYELLKSQASTVPNCDPALCMAIDAYNAKVYRAKGQQKQLLTTVVSSCKEITVIWPSIEPPASYAGAQTLKIA